MSVLESPKSYGSGYKFGVAKGAVEVLHGVFEFKDDDVSERSLLCVLFQDSLAGFVLSFWFFRLGLPSLISTPTFVFFSPNFSTDLLLLYRAVFVLCAIVCTVRDNWFKFSFATFVEFFNVRDSWCMEQINCCN